MALDGRLFTEVVQVHPVPTGVDREADFLRREFRRAEIRGQHHLADLTLRRALRPAREIKKEEEFVDAALLLSKVKVSDKKGGNPYSPYRSLRGIIKTGVYGSAYVSHL